mmetsp:Transcript_2229/g.3088  ORF Transcript_2229/g.3088 Transcript_2229/m.3088 type:complete len:88 (-) Transcript_2229:221-484(-)
MDRNSLSLQKIAAQIKLDETLAVHHKIVIDRVCEVVIVQEYELQVGHRVEHIQIPDELVIIEREGLEEAALSEGGGYGSGELVVAEA